MLDSRAWCPRPASHRTEPFKYRPSTARAVAEYHPRNWARSQLETDKREGTEQKARASRVNTNGNSESCVSCQQTPLSAASILHANDRATKNTSVIPNDVASREPSEGCSLRPSIVPQDTSRQPASRRPSNATACRGQTAHPAYVQVSCTEAKIMVFTEDANLSQTATLF